MDAGVQINLVSREMLGEYTSEDKVSFIISEVKKGKVLVLESGLDPMEETGLMQRTMSEIDHETFIGIEIQGYYNRDEMKKNVLKRIFKRRTPPRMTVIGPADHLRTIYKDGKVIQTLVLTSETFIEGSKQANIGVEEEEEEDWTDVYQEWDEDQELEEELDEGPVRYRDPVAAKPAVSGPAIGRPFEHARAQEQVA